MDAMRKISTSLPGVIILEPRIFGDERGFFLESYNEKVFADLGIDERLFRTIIPARGETYCAACITRSTTRKGKARSGRR